MKWCVVLPCLVAAALGCGEVLEGLQGTFTSPGYPNSYDNSLNCEWTISVPEGIVRISFTDFDVEAHTSCTYDSVTIVDPASGTTLATLCGANIPNAVSASGRSVVVRMRTDSSVNAGGFSAAWSVDDGTSPPTDAPSEGCGGTLESETGSISSPNYPGEYPASSDCSWTISIPEGVIALSFDDLSIESASSCSYDYVKVYEGNTLLATVCGTGSPKVEATRSNSVRVVFKSDSSVQQKGFLLSWSRLTCASKGLSCVADNAACGNGILKSGLYCETGVCCEPPFDQGECGIRPAMPKVRGGRPRIVGGSESDHHEWPWQVSLRTTSSNFHFCGGSMIEERWIVTAAHCVDGDTPAGLKVVTGEHNEGVSTGKEEDHAVEKIIMHEGYDGNGAGFPNDIALLKLSDPIARDDFRQPICLADADESFYGENIDCFITGWGRTLNESNAGILNELHVSVWDQQVCTNTWGSSYINGGHICVGTGDTGACNGDSGGPLACEMQRGGQNRWVLAGATSWGRSGCNTAGYPSVYSRVSYFRSWLLSTIRAN